VAAVVGRSGAKEADSSTVDVEGILDCSVRLPHGMLKVLKVISGDLAAAPHHILELGTLADWD
jgi:hypothetical protein